MTFIESSAFALVLLFIMGNGYLLLRYTVRDVQLATRYLIRYQNYHKKQAWFKLEPNAFTELASLLFIMIGVVLTLIYLFTDYVRVYAVILIPLTITTTLFYFSERSISKTQLPVQKFDGYYEDIHTLIEEKTTMLASIRSLKANIEEKETSFISMMHALNPMLTTKLPSTWYKSTTQPIHDTLDGYQKDLLKYDNSITGKFNDVLKQYLKTLKMTSILTVPSLVTFNVEDIQVSIDETKPLMQQQLLKESQEWIQQGRFVSPKACIDLISYLDTIAPQPSTHIHWAFAYFDTTEEKSLWIDYLTQKKWISAAFLTQSNYVEDYPWVFQESLYQVVPRDHAYDLMKFLHDKNLQTSSMSMLMNLPTEYQSLPERFVKSIKVNNPTTDIFLFFSTIYSHFSHFVDPTTIDLNRTYAIANYYQVLSTNAPISIAAITTSGTFVEERMAIEKAYEEAFNALKPLKNNLFEVLLWMKQHINYDEPIVRVDESVLLLLDLHKTLSVEKMHHFMFALFLIIDDQLPGQLTIDMLSTWGKLTGKYFGLTFTINSIDQSMTKIRSFYSKINVRQELSSILYRIETHRLLLTDLLEKNNA
jgi:hypothetical protein